MLPPKRRFPANDNDASAALTRVRYPSRSVCRWWSARVSVGRFRNVTRRRPACPGLPIRAGAARTSGSSRRCLLQWPELDRVRALVVREALPAERDDLLGGGRGALVQRDGVLRPLPVQVRDPDDRAFEHAQVGGHPLTRRPVRYGRPGAIRSGTKASRTALQNVARCCRVRSLQSRS
jgi:hypothetical protein